MELSQILTTMKGESITNNWDVVCAMSAARLTELFEEKYNSANHGGLVYHIEQTVSILDGLASVEIDLTIRPPLISFNKIVDPVANGFSTALIISSRVLMCVGLYPSLRKLGPVEQVMPIKDEEEDISGLWKIRCTGGSKKLGKPGIDFDIGLDLRGFRFPEDVEVSFAGLTLETDEVQGIKSIHPKVTQSYSYRKKIFPGGSSGRWVTYELDLHFESNGEYHSSILEAGDRPGDQGVVFDDKEIKSTVTHDRISGSKPDADRIGEAVDIQFRKVYEDLILFDMKGISTFAVSNLLFPEDRIIEFGKKDDGTEDQGVYIPGDMLIVGRVKPLSE